MRGADRRPGRRILRLAGLLAAAGSTAPADRAAAHPLDEYVQASYLTLGSSGIAVDLELRPGVDVARRVLALLDTDGDGSLSAAEGRAYAARAAGDLRLTVDGKPLPLTLISYRFPEAAALLTGRADIRMHLRAPPWSKEVRGARAGVHRLVYRNAHAPVRSAYLVNAYRPDPPLSILEQRRDSLQREIRIRYRIAEDRLVWWIWIFPAALMLLVGLGWAARRGRARPPGGPAPGGRSSPDGASPYFEPAATQ